MTFKERFNWLAQKPDRNYTLGEVYQHFVQGKDWSEVEDNRFNLTRLGRAWERTHTAVGVAGAGLLLTIPEAPLLMSTLGPVGNMVFWKALGIGMGIMVSDQMRTMTKNQPKP